VLARNSFEASFADETAKRAWEHRLKGVFETFSEQD
jgi:adenine deaminase